MIGGVQMENEKMSDLISRQAAIDAVSEACFELRGVFGRCEEALKALPSADVVEVVRCKDCKWYKTNYSWNGKEHKVCVIEPYEPGTIMSSLNVNGRCTWLPTINEATTPFEIRATLFALPPTVFDPPVI